MPRSTHCTPLTVPRFTHCFLCWKEGSPSTIDFPPSCPCPTSRTSLFLAASFPLAAGWSLICQHSRLPTPSPSPPVSSGQTQPTRVVRLLAEDTVEQRVLRLQQHKAQTCRSSQQQQKVAAQRGGGAAGAAGPSSGMGQDGTAVDAGSAGEEVLVQDLDGGTLVRFFDEL